MPWTMQKPPNPAKNWPDGEKRACVRAANAALKGGGTDKEAIRACLGAGARVKQKSSSPPGGETMKDGRIVDLFMAEKVLAGEPVRLIPILDTGYWRWGEMQPPITKTEAEILVSNFDKRASLGTHQTNLPFNIEHVASEGKIGTISELILGHDEVEDGVYAKFDLTDRGRELLGQDRFDYLSPEIIWDLEDTETGASVGPFVVGAAATNYPYFGDKTAMFSREAGEHLETLVDLQGWEGSLSPTQVYMAAVEAIHDIFREAGANLLKQQTEVKTMTEPREGAEEMQVPEEFTNRLAELESQAEKFTTMLAARDEQITAQEQVITGQRTEIDGLAAARLRERFSRQVEGLSHIGAENEQLVEQLMWLHTTDDSEDRAHFAYFSAMMATMEQAMAQSAAFQEAGQPGHRQGGTAYSRFSALVQEEAGKRNLVVSEGDANWAVIVTELAEANPALYTEHVNQTRAQGVRH